MQIYMKLLHKHKQRQNYIRDQSIATKAKLMQTKIVKISYHCKNEINKKQQHKVHRCITKQKNLKLDYQDQSDVF